MPAIRAAVDAQQMKAGGRAALVAARAAEVQGLRGRFPQGLADPLVVSYPPFADLVAFFLGFIEPYVILRTYVARFMRTETSGFFRFCSHVGFR